MDSGVSPNILTIDGSEPVEDAPGIEAPVVRVGEVNPGTVERSKDAEKVVAKDVDRKPKAVTNPKLPSQAEIDEHNLTHSPYRNWCAICVKAWGQEDHHRTDKSKVDSEVPIVDMDYGYMKYKDKDVDGKLEKRRDRKTDVDNEVQEYQVLYGRPGIGKRR